MRQSPRLRRSWEWKGGAVPVTVLSALLLALLLLAPPPLLAQEPECDDPPPLNAPIPGTLLTYCVTNPSFTCDLAITPWDPATHRSPDLRIGDPFTSPSPEQPRFFLDAPGNRYYTKLYARFTNQGGGPAPASEVTVDFAFKDTGNPMDVNNPAVPWQHVDTYAMNIPASASASVGALFPGATHQQDKGVCWHVPASTGFPQQFILRAVVDWSAGPDGDTTNNVAYSFYDFSAYERVAQIALALDLSGSMSASLPGGGSKLTAALQKAALFANLVEQGNQLGAYSFATGNPANTHFTATYVGTDGLSHTATLGDTAVVEALRAVDDAGDGPAVATQILTQGAHDCTPVGQGLLRARDAFASLTPPAGAGKAIVLFSDGLQNVPPFVNAAPLFPCGSAPAMTPIDAEDTLDAEGIDVYSVYFGPESGWAYDLMNQIKEQTGGDYVYGAGTELELAAAYYAIRGLVDDLVFLDEGSTTSAGAPWPRFGVEFDGAGTRPATVAVAWPHGDGETRLTVDYRPAGSEEWRSSRQELPQGLTEVPVHRLQGSDWASFHVFRFTPGADSAWEFRVRQLTPRQGSTSYTAAVFTPVQAAQIQAELDDTAFTAGDPLPIRAVLRSAGLPLPGAAVTATVQAPARRFSNTLRRYADRLDVQTSGGDPGAVSAMAARLGRLLADDEGAPDLYPRRAVRVTLSDNGDGTYTGVLPAAETRLAGPYEVTVHARATLPSGREVSRIARLSTVADVGPADAGRSTVRVDRGPLLDGGSRLVTVTVLPTDALGNAAFPGSARRIAVTASGARLRGGVVDGLDSTFTQTLVVPRGVDPAVSVTVDGRSLPVPPVGGGAAGPVSRRHEFSFHAGLTLPQGRFGRVFDDGWNVGVDYAHRFSSGFALRTEAVWSEVDDPAGDALGLFHVTSFLQHRWQAGDWQPYFEAGLGYYDPERTGSAVGFAAGVGTYLELTPRWNLDLNLHGHRMGGGLDLTYSTVRAGAVVNF